MTTLKQDSNVVRLILGGQEGPSETIASGQDLLQKYNCSVSLLPPWLSHLSSYLSSLNPKNANLQTLAQYNLLHQREEGHNLITLSVSP